MMWHRIRNHNSGDAAVSPVVRVQVCITTGEWWGSLEAPQDERVNVVLSRCSWNTTHRKLRGWSCGDLETSRATPRECGR